MSLQCSTTQRCILSCGKCIWDIESMLSNLQSTTHKWIGVKFICTIFVHKFLLDVQDKSIEVDLNSIDDEGELGFGDSNNDVNIQRVAGTTRDALLRHLRSLNN